MNFWRDSTPVEKPLFVLFAGGPATGKSYLAEVFMGQKGYQKSDYKIIDTDLLLEWYIPYLHAINKSTPSSDAPESCRTFTKEFSAEIVNIGMKNRYNMVYLATGKNSEKNSKKNLRMPLTNILRLL